MRSQLPPLELVCFGPPTALLGGHQAPAEVLWAKHLALLIYLALSPEQRRTREHLVGVFWGERPEGRARGNLSAVLHRLRGCLGEGRLRSEGQVLVLSRDGLEVDALRFEGAALRRPEEAVALVRGDFLEGFQVQDTPEFDDWATRERRRYRALAVERLVALGEQRLTAHRLAEAGDAARRALTLAPHSEPAIRLVMRAAALGGDGTAALAAFHDFDARLKRDTGEDVPRALAALAERVRYGRWSKRAPRVAANEVDPPLVGRDRVHREAFDTLSRGLAAGPQALAIIGAPGMGRTRLLRECADRLELEGTLVFFARPLENDQDAPWSTLRLLLRQLADAPGLTGASPDAVGVLAGLSPALAERFPQREVRDVADMAASLADVLAAVAEERPLTIALDDAHWADGASLAALRAALVSVRRVPIVLVLTVATGVADPPRELLALQSEIGRTLPGTSVRLDPLTDEDLGALVAAIAPWCADRTDRGRLTRRLARETGGNPFFAVTLLRALQQATALRADLVSWPPPEEPTDAPLPFSIPSLLRHALGARLTDLGDEDILVLRAASVCGQQIDMDLVAHVAERMPADVERALPAFERRQLVAFDGQRYAFVAPLVAEVVRAQCLTKGERQRLERRAIEALGSRTDLEGRVRRVELLAGVGPGAAAFAEAVAVGREALAVGAMRVARRALHAAERAGEGAADRAALAALREGVRRERRA